MCREMEKLSEEAERICRLRDILNLMDYTKWNVSRAMNALRIDPEERKLFADSVAEALKGSDDFIHS